MRKPEAKADNEKRKRGRKAKDETRQRAEFARPLIDDGLSWPEVFRQYVEKYSDDVEASPDAIRLAYTRHFPPE